MLFLAYKFLPFSTTHIPSDVYLATPESVRSAWKLIGDRLANLCALLSEPDDRLWHLADILANQRFGRYRGLSGHQPAPIGIA